MSYLVRIEDSDGCVFDNGVEFDSKQDAIAAGNAIEKLHPGHAVVLYELRELDVLKEQPAASANSAEGCDG